MGVRVLYTSDLIREAFQPESESMKRPALNRRAFVAQSAGVAGVAAVAGDLPAAPIEHAEVLEWKNSVGTRFRVEDKTLTLNTVAVMDYSKDRARPSNLRPHAISLLFVDEETQSKDASSLDFRHADHQILLSRVVAPEGRSGAYYEGVIN